MPATEWDCTDCAASAAIVQRKRIPYANLGNFVPLGDALCKALAALHVSTGWNESQMRCENEVTKKPQPFQCSAIIISCLQSTRWNLQE